MIPIHILNARIVEWPSEPEGAARYVATFDCLLAATIFIGGCVLRKREDGTFKANMPRANRRDEAFRGVRINSPALRDAIAAAAVKLVAGLPEIAAEDAPPAIPSGPTTRSDPRRRGGRRTATLDDATHGARQPGEGF